MLLQACQVVADLLRLVSALPVAGLFDHQPAARAAALGAGAGLQGGAPASGLPVLATSLKPARPAPGGGRSAGLASALPVAGLVDHRSAARAAAPGAGAGLSGSAPASGLLMLATSSKLARPAPGAGRSAGLVSALPVVGLVDHRSAAQAAAPGAAASLPAVSMLLACAGIPAARTLRGRRLVAELQRLASVLPAAGLWSITGTLPKLLHLVALQACRRCPCRWPVPGDHQLEPRVAGACWWPIRCCWSVRCRRPGRSPAHCPSCCTWFRCRPAGSARAAGLCCAQQLEAGAASRLVVADPVLLASAPPARPITSGVPKLPHLVPLQACRQCPCCWPVLGAQQLESCAADAWWLICSGWPACCRWRAQPIPCCQPLCVAHSMSHATMILPRPPDG